MTPPIVHLNGTSGESLEEQYSEALEALARAIRAHDAAAPSMRDYYPATDRDAYRKARDEHTARAVLLASVREELGALLESVMDQNEARAARRA